MARLKPDNFWFLLFGLLIVLLIAPIASSRFPGFVGLAFAGTLVVGVWSLARTGWAYIAGWILAGSSILVGGLDVGFQNDLTDYLGALIAFLFCLLSIGIVLREVLFSKVVDANRIVGSVCIYLLLGLSWTFIYFVVHLSTPASFDGMHPDADPFLDLLYYSFVTLTTLGYGDISPATPMARAFAYLEAVSGVMYVAILVASLVGSVASGEKRSD